MYSRIDLSLRLLLSLSLIWQLCVFEVRAGIDVWTSTGPEGGVVHALAVSRSNSDVIYAGTHSNGVYKSTNGGASWTPVNGGLRLIYRIHGLAIDPSNPNVIYTGTDGGDIFKSTDGGASWLRIRVGRVGTWAYTLLINPSNTNIVYAGILFGAVAKFPIIYTGGGLLEALSPIEERSFGVIKSTDGGASWTEVLNKATSALAMAPSNPDTLYATDSLALFKSTDGGANWVEKSSGLPGSNVETLAIDWSSPRAVYAGTFSGLYKSTDGGDNWRPARSGLDSPFIDHVVIDPVPPNVIYAATDRGVFQSLNRGQNWDELSAGITNESMSRIALNPADTRSIYATTVGSGVIQQQIRKPEIFSVAFERKDLSIKGRNLGSSPRIVINNADRSCFVVEASEAEIKLRGKAKKLKIKTGNNTIQVIRSDGTGSNTFTMSF